MSMEKIVSDLRKMLPLKSTTSVGDIVIIAAEEPQFLVYAKVIAIERDDTRKTEWWHVTMKMLGIPLQTVTWTLRTPQLSGQETFTMGGHGRFIQAVDLEVDQIDRQPEPKNEQKSVPSKSKGGLRIVK